MTESKQDGSARKVPMQVLCFGQSRTGTSSAQAALNRLGFSPCYHYQELIPRPSHQAFWSRAFAAKYHHPHHDPDPALRTPEYWDQILGPYAAATDNPCVYFFEELLAAYPHAHIILQTRHLPPWADSFVATISTCLYDPVIRHLCGFDAATAGWVRLTTGMHETYFRGRITDKALMMQVHAEFLAKVREAVPRGRLLEWNVRDGWGPLCAHLGVQQVPDEPFPRVFEKEEFLGLVAFVRRDLLKKAAWWVGSRVVLPVGMVGCQKKLVFWQAVAALVSNALVLLCVLLCARKFYLIR